MSVRGNTSEMSIELLDLDFSKKNKNSQSALHAISLTDRKNTTVNWTTEVKTQRNILIEKKKNYSEAIRERNMNSIKSKKKNAAQNDTRYHLSSKENQPKSSKNLHAKPELPAAKSFSAKRTRQLDISALDFEPIPKASLHEVTMFQDLGTEVAQKKQQEAEQEKLESFVSYGFKNDITSNATGMQICSREVNMVVREECKDTLLLQRQNSTFKRDLASIRKQNGALKKQLQDCKQHIKQLQQHAGKLLTNCSPMKSAQPTESAECAVPGMGMDSTEIIERMRMQISNLNSLNSSLELKLFMTEKKLIEEVNICKKKVAKDLATWRQKVAKLRAENLKYKTSYRDLTLSMNISQDDD